MPRAPLSSARACRALALLSPALLACQEHDLAAPEPRPGVQTTLVFTERPKLDLLFLIDDSGSMEEEQKTLRQNFPLFMRELEEIEGGIPDLHIAVVSSDFGAGDLEVESCSQQGKRGRFQVKEGCGLDAKKARFLATDGKAKNFEGELASVFSCLADLGTEGCGYEHQLQAIRVALSDANAENEGFLRDEAHLGIIILSDEDDCSADPGVPIFSSTLPGQALDLRCATLGHVCGGRPAIARPLEAPLASCVPYERREGEERSRLINVSEIVDWVKGVKGGRTSKIIVSGVFGWSDDPDAKYQIQNTGTELSLRPICGTKENGQAAPAVRLKAFVDAFGRNGSHHPICQTTLTDAMKRIGQEFADVLRRRCLPAPLVDLEAARDGVQPDCSVVERVRRAGGIEEMALPRCGPGAEPCWDLVADLECGFGYRIDVRRPPGGKPPVDTVEAVKCSTAAGR